MLERVRQAKGSSTLTGKRVYVDIGGDFGDVRVPAFDPLDHATSVHWWNPGYFWLDTQLQPGVDAMHRALLDATATSDDMVSAYCLQKFPGGRHNERAWAQRIDKPLMHLLSGPPSPQVDEGWQEILEI